jgi:hypothetical protein
MVVFYFNSLHASYHLSNFPLSQYFHANNDVCCLRTTALITERCFCHMYSQAWNKFSLYIDVSQEDNLRPAWKELEEC